MANHPKRGRALVMSVIGIAVLAIAWALIGAIAQPRALAAFREDYEIAKFGKDHPIFVRIINNEDAVRAGETFARDYEALEDAGYFMAPVRALTTAISHDKYDDYINPSEREKFEKERREREEREAKDDTERLKEIEKRERENQ